MKSAIKFLTKLVLEFKKNELYYLGNELTYKMVLAIFPLMIFLLNVFVGLNIERETILLMGEGTIPDEVLKTITSFLDSIENATNQENITGTLSWSIIVTIVSAASGFRSIIRGINKTYRIKEKRNFVVKSIIAVFLVLQFVAVIVIAAISLVFGDVIIGLIESIGLFPQISNGIFGFFTYLLTIIIMLIDVMLIYKISVEERISFFSTLPGAAVTVVFWIVSSKLFNIYINNFSNYNNIYGGIGSMFIFIFWINIIALVLLFGSQINALIEVESKNI